MLSASAAWADAIAKTLTDNAWDFVFDRVPYDDFEADTEQCDALLDHLRRLAHDTRRMNADLVLGGIDLAGFPSWAPPSGAETALSWLREQGLVAPVVIRTTPHGRAVRRILFGRLTTMARI